MRGADADMGRVLQAHQKLGQKPISQLTPAQARQQPTPADAVKAVLKEEGKTPPAPQVKKQNMTYQAGVGLQPIRIYTPSAAPADGLRPIGDCW